MLICQSCDFFDESSDRCNHCGCFLKIKTSWASEKCPIDKWLSEIEPENIQEQQQQNPPVKDCGCKNK